MEISDLTIQKDIKIKKKDALIIVDMQYDFLPGGALAVENGDSIIAGINIIASKFHESLATVILTQDWHPKDHLSFASSHRNKEPGDLFTSEDEAIGPVLWPDHCVQGSKGAEFHENLQVDFARAIIRKGFNPKVDSYSAFLENDKKHETGLRGYLNTINVERLFLCGLALDYCVYYSAIDGVKFGFESNVLIDLTKGIDDPEDNISKALEDMVNKGVKFANQESF
ncbi:MAG: Nicotinamidase/pyrazinamidase [Promethearchaeota archaeon]|nr:MAG: Nicotinamidase/pyrazinamidase [Candidatus Lokiarchaeota archaeon]